MMELEKPIKEETCDCGNIIKSKEADHSLLTGAEVEVKKEVKKEVKEEVKEECEDCKPAQSQSTPWPLTTPIGNRDVFMNKRMRKDLKVKKTDPRDSMEEALKACKNKDERVELLQNRIKTIISENHPFDHTKLEIPLYFLNIELRTNWRRMTKVYEQVSDWISPYIFPVKEDPEEDTVRDEGKKVKVVHSLRGSGPEQQASGGSL